MTYDRVWVTFAYVGALEIYFQGAPALSFINIEVIRNEAEMRENELIEPQIKLPLLTVTV